VHMLSTEQLAQQVVVERHHACADSLCWHFLACCVLQTFSGPVRRRLGARSWGAEGSVREQDLPVGPVDSTAASPTAAGTGQKRSKGLLGSAAAAWEGRPAGLAQSGVSRIDEGEGGEEL
jgi:hypothetical protein